MLSVIPLKSVLKEIIVLLLLSVGTALIVNYFSPKGIAFFGEWDLDKGVISSNPKNKIVDHGIEIKDISTVKKYYDSGEPLFLDARSREVYEEGHIRGAISMPVYMFDGIIETFMATYALDKFLITYCSGRECDDSHELARYLIDLGYFNVKVFIDGYPEWEKKGYPIE